MDANAFHDKMHALIFRGMGASRLGAVQTTVVWQFVVFHFSDLDSACCKKLVCLQEQVNECPRNSDKLETAIAALLSYVKELDTGGR